MLRASIFKQDDAKRGEAALGHMRELDKMMPEKGSLADGAGIFAVNLLRK
jgi:hypothetical protein